MIFKNKKAIAGWISWVLVIGMGVMLSILVYYWMVERTNASTEEMQTLVYDSSECSAVGINIDAVCQDTQALYMNLSNTDNLAVNALFFRMLTIFGDVGNKEINITIKAGRTEMLTVIKDGTIKRLEVTPVTEAGQKRIVCSAQTISTESIKYC